MYHVHHNNLPIVTTENIIELPHYMLQVQNILAMSNGRYKI